MNDPRFANIKSDPKFRRVPKAQNKVKIDRRFKSMFTDKKFQVKYTIDKRGRPVSHHSKEDLKRYYKITSDDENDEQTQSSKNRNKTRKKEALRNEGEAVKNKENSDEENKLNVKRKGDKSLPDHVKEKLFNLNVDYARGEENLYPESSSDDEETEAEESESEQIDHKWGELDLDAEKTQESTYRLAACNLDWDRIRAVDLMVLLNSFLPSTGIIKSIAIYPSEFGKQRMKEEESKGPSELVETEIKEENSEEETEEGATFHMEKLRQYQLNRLKYYYAVITFDSAATANKIYEECDGMEYESSATKMDLRFIPDDTTFDDDTPKETCDSLPSKYEPRFFATTALQQAKVKLTWDETDVNRLEFAEKLNSGKLNDITEQDLHNYLAESDGEEEVEDDKISGDEAGSDISDSQRSQSETTIDKYKALLQDIQQKEDEKKNKDFEMEISWEIDLKEKTDQLVKDQHANTADKTPFQKYLDKRKEKRKEKIKQRKTDVKNDNQPDSDGSDVPSDIDMNDPYFAEEFDNNEFRTKIKKKKGKNRMPDGDDDANKQKEAELDLLLMNSEEKTEKHFSLKKIQEQEMETTKKKKRKKKLGVESNRDADDFQVDVEDERFSALFNSHLYSIDPTDPNYKKTKNMEKFVEEKLKRRNAEDLKNEQTKKMKVDEISEEGSEEGIRKRKDVELDVLVKTVKRKTEAYKHK